MTSPFGPFGSQIERLGDLLINKVSDEIFGDGDAARLTRVMIYNHTSQDLFFLDSSFESGGFSAGMQPDKIEADAIGGYRDQLRKVNGRWLFADRQAFWDYSGSSA